MGKSYKELAFLAATNAGLIRKTENDGKDTEAFNRFWQLYRKSVADRAELRYQRYERTKDLLDTLMDVSIAGFTLSATVLAWVMLVLLLSQML